MCADKNFIEHIPLSNRLKALIYSQCLKLMRIPFILPTDWCMREYEARWLYLVYVRGDVLILDDD